MGRVVFILILILSVPTFAEYQCGEISLRFYYGQKYVYEKSKICIDHDQQELISEQCYKQKKCVALKAVKNTVGSEEYSTVGSPSFATCFEASGTPQIIEYKLNGKWHKSDRCIFSDKSFIDTQQFLRLVNEDLKNYQ
ncbi:MAG: hypothetical protein KDD38_02085 [Bdellovibrionales bacterium]|nr:hypothetical protein [Bdellovibrionales bacterium]